MFAAAGSGTLEGRQVLAHSVAVSLTAGAAMLALALAVVFALIVWPRSAAAVAASGPVGQPLPATVDPAAPVEEALAEQAATARR